MGSVSITYRPLTQWPAGRAKTSTSARKRSPFDSTYTDTLDLFDRELHMIAARDVVLQVDVASEREIRRDGEFRADARVSSPAVVLSFTRGTTPLVFATDYYKDWQDNVRAIALGLEGLRRLERYHIGQSGDQYRGWQALPASTTPALNVEQAAAFLARMSGQDAAAIKTLKTAATTAYRSAAANTHPDRGGSTGNFQLTQEAKRVLEAHFGSTL